MAQLSNASLSLVAQLPNLRLPDATTSGWTAFATRHAEQLTAKRFESAELDKLRNFAADGSFAGEQQV